MHVNISHVCPRLKKEEEDEEKEEFFLCSNGFGFICAGISCYKRNA